MKAINLLHIFFALLGLGLVACGSNKKSPEQKLIKDDEIVSVRLYTLATDATDISIIASGITGSSSEARLGFKTGGVIQKIYVKENERITKGQTLATLNLTEINAQVEQASQAVKKAKRDLTRVKNLNDDDVATLEQVQNARTALAVAQQNLVIAQYNRGFSEIKAIYSGIVVRKLMNEGELVAPGNPVFFTVSTSLEDRIVKVAVTDKDLARIRKGNTADIVLDAFPDKIFKSIVSTLPAAADPTSGLYQVELRLMSPPPNLVIGMFAKAKIHLSASETMIGIPPTALIEGDKDQAFVFIVKENKALKISVKIAYMTTDKIYIASGLENIQAIIAEGSAYLTDGSVVKVVK